MSTPENFNEIQMRNQNEKEEKTSEQIIPDSIQLTTDSARDQIVAISDFEPPQEILDQLTQEFQNERDALIDRFCMNHGPVSDYNFKLLEDHLLKLEIEKASQIYYRLRKQGIKPKARLNYPHINQTDFASQSATSVINAILSLNPNSDELPDDQEESIKFLYEQMNLYITDYLKPSSDRRPLMPVQKFFSAQRYVELGFPNQYQFQEDPTLMDIVYNLTTGEGVVLLADEENCALANNITSRDGGIFIKILDPKITRGTSKKLLKSQKMNLEEFAKKHAYPLDYISRWSGGGVFYDNDKKKNRVFTADQIRSALNYQLIPGTFTSSLSSKSLKTGLITLNE